MRKSLTNTYSRLLKSEGLPGQSTYRLRYARAFVMRGTGPCHVLFIGLTIKPQPSYHRPLHVYASKPSSVSTIYLSSRCHYSMLFALLSSPFIPLVHVATLKGERMIAHYFHTPEPTGYAWMSEGLDC